MDRLIAKLKKIQLGDDVPEYEPSKRLNICKRLQRYRGSLSVLHNKSKADRELIRPLSLEEQAKAGLFSEKDLQDEYGDVLFTKIVNCMNEFGKGKDKEELRVDQRVMFAHAMGALLPLIYGNKLESNRERLLKMLGLTKIRQELVIFAPRRVGKTYFVAMMLASLLVYMPKVEIAVFGLGKRTSAKVMRLVMDMLMKHPKCPKILTKNSEELKLEGATPSTYKLLHSFPDTVHVCVFIL